ncbi:hypothetical protein KIN20_007441 [Parelaphostrongylus tenuis]|uniref:Uncharacterized protein n=1 Tax=Parelaphostrongylus tenuis TaxID=148309 RepID=A0AAD5MLH9_PARTN|nr:hypothetical protein KIN20_007441 [Parelaphostrongylus tenuis]
MDFWSNSFHLSHYVFYWSRRRPPQICICNGGTQSNTNVLIPGKGQGVMSHEHEYYARKGQRHNEDCCAESKASQDNIVAGTSNLGD